MSRSRISFGRLWPMGAALAGVWLAAACGGATPDAGRAEGTAGGGASARRRVPVNRIERCGGFTRADAAAVLGLAADAIETRSELEHETLRTCVYASRDGDLGQAVSFSLTWEETADEQQASLAQERETLALAQQTIGAATGGDEQKPAVEEVDGLGDEAFYTTVNETLVVRVANVRIQVMLPEDLERMKAVARRVAEGLRPQRAT